MDRLEAKELIKEYPICLIYKENGEDIRFNLYEYVVETDKEIERLKGLNAYQQKLERKAIEKENEQNEEIEQYKHTLEHHVKEIKLLTAEIDKKDKETERLRKALKDIKLLSRDDLIEAWTRCLEIIEQVLKREVKKSIKSPAITSLSMLQLKKWRKLRHKNKH